jgi:hypothetical protein
LRTLVFAKKIIDAKFYSTWREVHNQALIQMIGRKDAIRKAAELLETEMELIGITGVEDR